jgi:hypothetical protein
LVSVDLVVLDECRIDLSNGFALEKWHKRFDSCFVVVGARLCQSVLLAIDGKCVCDEVLSRDFSPTADVFRQFPLRFGVLASAKARAALNFASVFVGENVPDIVREARLGSRAVLTVGTEELEPGRAGITRHVV